MLYFTRMYDHILIDGKNCAYRAVYAAHSDQNKAHPVTIILRQIGRMRRLFNPKKWHIFWDVRKEELWRRDVLPTYKDGRHKDQGWDVGAAVHESQAIAAQVFRQMNITQYIRAKNEADDLIYAFVQAYTPAKMVIVSADADLTQIPFKNSNVDVHNPTRKDVDILPKPEIDPVLVKSLAGDGSDNIDGYRLVADKTAIKLLNDPKRLEEFFKKMGKDIYERNNKIVDLNRNPHLEDNINYVKSVPSNNRFDLAKIQQLIAQHSIVGLSSEIGSILPFKHN